jgi:hypothetical protein
MRRGDRAAVAAVVELGYAPERCRQLVMEGIAADRAALNRMKDAYTAEASGCATFASIFLDEKSNLRIYVPQADIKKQFSGFPLNRSYTVRATVLDVGFGGPSGYWSPAFIDGVFSAQERSQSLTRQATF